MRAKIEEWQAGEIDEDTKAVVAELLAQEKWAELEDCFAGLLEFGTAGLRGVLGPGPNRMNAAVVVKTTLGLVNALKAKGMHDGVIVGYDGRRKSDEFAHLAVGVLLAHGMPVHLFRDCVPTPLVAYGILAKQASAGVVITASHNPPEYNGYKVFWQNGAQIIAPIDAEIKGHIEKSGAANQIPCLRGTELEQHKLLQSAEPLIADYEHSISELGLPPDRTAAAQLTVAYTPMHGVGARILEKVFADNGFTNLHTVAEQRQPDADFPTVNFPNPEEEGAMDFALALGTKTQADLVLANDPDADRLAAAVRDEQGAFVMLSGNEIGVILGHHLLTLAKDHIQKALVVNSIVSTSLLGRIAQKLGAKHAATLTGFKWIANTGIRLEQEQGLKFVFGFEEALGSTPGTLVRDKDGISAALVFCKLAADLKKQGRGIWDYLGAIYRDYGLFQTRQQSITLKGQKGLQKIQQIMQNTRQKLPQKLGPYAIQSIMDIEAGVIRDVQTGKQEAIDLPKSNVMIFDLEGEHRVILRPSGTEPKLKIYYEVRFEMADNAAIRDAKKGADKEIDALAASVQHSFM